MSRHTSLLVALAIAILVFAVDQGIKSVVEGSMRVGESITLVSGFLSLTYIKNDGGAFGILGGAAGNFLDRLSSGEVTDYIHFSFWYIFNAADAAIVVGVGLLLLSALHSDGAGQRPAVGDK